MRFRTMKGLGDAIYAYPIVKYFARTEHVTVCTQYPQVFKYLENVTTTDKDHVDEVFLSYSRNPDSNQYKDICDTVGIYPEFKFEWPATVFTHIPKYCIIKEPCCSHMNKRFNDFSLAPKVSYVQDWVYENQERYTFISVGKDEIFKGRIAGIDHHMIDTLSIEQFLGLCAGAAAIATQIGHLVPIAQAMGKPLKIFEPEFITDPRLQNMSINKVRVDGVDNEIL